ncbi:FGGY-family carbohydrate kinase [Microbacterium sp. zg-Y818]|uniref:gluconokinase n=1 Tax=unclassified Microbacterium TaxID=2609290 RepID=UPI00214B9D78|nr:MULTISPECIES: FGGY-family carbohydrate kinase [unclassified Microbacterium]MCR2801392.1 FGGY-family carbohydrate kinase [Microbacterium sp. zg.Y818]WIM21215.1 FGGY-family carbohydrate kinase [Microbacterium sp. zg-Y818]
MKILALEASTTSAKTMLFDTETGDVQAASRRFEHDGADAAVRDGDAICAQLLALGRESAGGGPVDLIVLSGTWHGVTLRRRDLTAVTPVMEWPYTGAQDLSARLRRDDEFTRWFHDRTGCMVNASYPAFKLMHLREQGIDLAGTLALDQPTLIFARLTGETWTNASLASGTGLLNARSAEWDAEVADRLGLGDVALPPLHPSTAAAPLTAEGAAALGLRAGIPVLTPGPDGGLSQVGDLATEPGEMTFSMGTSGALRIATRHPSPSPSFSTWSYRSPVGPLSGAATSGCGNCVDWARERLFGADVHYADLEPLLSPDATDLPVFLPFLFGERSPGWQDQRRGGWLELQPHHTRADMYQGVLEGIVYSLYHCYRELVAAHGVPRRIVLSGGVLSSPMWTQLTADVFGVDMEVSTRQHSSLVGAVRMGLRATGHDVRHPALDGGDPALIRSRGERRDRYDAGFARYLDQYARTAPPQVSR